MKRVADARALGGSERVREPVPEVAATEIAARPLPVVFEVRGFLRGFEEVTAHSEVAGRVLEKPVSDGQAVEASSPLCVVDDTFYALAVRKAAANVAVGEGQYQEALSAVAVAEAQRHDASAARDSAKIEFARIRELYQDSESPQIEYERYETQLERAEAQLASAEAALERARRSLAAGEAAVQVAEATLAEARERHARCRVAAPISGTLDQTFYEVGEYVVAGQPLAEIIRLDRLKLVVELTGPQVGTLDAGSRADITVDAAPGVVYEGQLNHVAPKADPQTRKFRVEFHLDNPDARLRAGMFALARIRSTEWSDAVIAPRHAFFRQFGSDLGFVVDEVAGEAPVARLRQMILRDVPGRIEVVRVVEGLAPGDHLVVDRPRDLRDGMNVRVTRVDRASVGASESQP
jgi:multidrug efflux pump subunit AcrA (membrane-fusion protein)